MKKLILILFASLVLTSCTSSPSKQETTTTTPAVSVETWEYEYYIEDINYYMDMYIKAQDKAIEANDTGDIELLKQAYEDNLSALEKMSEIKYPETLKEKHSVFLSAIERETEYYEMLSDAVYYAEKYDSLTAKEQKELQGLEAKLDRYYIESENEISLWNAMSEAMNEAMTYLGWTVEEYEG